MKITFLGTGTSHGVPSIDCMIEGCVHCRKGVCEASLTDPHHARTRSSILVEVEDFSLLIDVSADFRAQMLREKIKKIDAVLITHGHADHIGGIPDIRSYTRLKNGPLQFYGSAESMDIIKQVYSYIFDSSTFVGGGIPNISLNTISDSVQLYNFEVVPVKVTHGNLKGCYGYRIGPLAYIPDLKAIADEELEKLAGVQVLILNCLRDEREHSTHLILPQSMALARKIAPRQCRFIHMCHDIHYQLDKEKLDPWMDFAYDGLVMVL